MWNFKDIVTFLPNGIPFRSIKADYGLFMMSLAKFHGTTLDNIPKDPKLILNRVLPDKEHVIGFNRGGAVAPKSRSLKVGIRWTGNHQADDNIVRSIPLEFLLELAENPNVTLYSLQVGKGSEDVQRLNAQELVTDIAEGMSARGYVGTASVLLHLDLVITTCTSIAHLAGSLDIPTWVLLSHNPFWIWLRNTDRSVWYDSVKLYRQPSPGDWISIIDQVKSDLKEYAGKQLDCNSISVGLS
jgi:hypothetical protein